MKNIKGFLQIAGIPLIAIILGYFLYSNWQSTKNYDAKHDKKDEVQNKTEISKNPQILSDNILIQRFDSIKLLKYKELKPKNKLDSINCQMQINQIQFQILLNDYMQTKLKLENYRYQIKLMRDYKTFNIDSIQSIINQQNKMK